MRCRQCDYPLWNLPTRVCPECGLPFGVSEYEFVPGTVEFCCPLCGQGYFGTSAKGHLVPESFECVACHVAMSMNSAVLRPAPGIDESRTEPIRNPWLARKRLGFLRAFFITLGKSLSNPGQLLRATPPGKAYGAARGFFFLVFAALLLASVVMIGLFALAAGGAGTAFAFAFGSCGLVGNPLFVVAWLIAVFLWGLATHLILLMTGGAKHGLSRTYEALCYGAGPMLFLMFPCIGIFATIWSVVSSTIAFRSAQQVSGGRAALCVVTPPLVTAILLFAGWMLLVVAVMNRMPAGGFGPATVTYETTPGGQARTFTSELLGFAERNQGSSPTHGLELLDRTAVSPQDFTATWPENVAHYGSTLEQFHTMMPQEREETLSSAARMITERTVAHRIGDVVFTFHGISDLRACDPGLWIVVIWDENQLETVNTTEPVWVGRADGSITSIPQADLPAALAQQNQLRAQFNLPPLPDPREVDPAQPAEVN